MEAEPSRVRSAHARLAALRRWRSSADPIVTKAERDHAIALAEDQLAELRDRLDRVESR